MEDLTRYLSKEYIQMADTYNSYTLMYSKEDIKWKDTQDH